MIKRKELEPSSNIYICHGSDDNSRYSRKIIDPMYEFTCANAVAIGHLHGCRWDESTCENAAENGHLNILCTGAAAIRHLNILQYAMRMGVGGMNQHVEMRGVQFKYIVVCL